MDRDPRIDPLPGDLIRSTNDSLERVALVRTVRDDDDDPDFGTHAVNVTEDTRFGSRCSSSMSLDTWRRWAEGADVLDPGLGDRFLEIGGCKLLEELQTA